MAQIPVVGKNTGQIDLDLPKADAHLLHSVVVWQLASRRRGTASTKTRAEVSRTGRKMYAQKGTGNARHGNRSVPTFVGGGVAFGPKPRDYSYSLPKKIRQRGLEMAIGDRAEQGMVLAVDGFELDGKTKGFVSWAKDNGMDGRESVLLVTDDAGALRAARNLSWVTALPVAGLNVYDILRHDRLVIDAARLRPAQEEAAQ